MQKNELRNSDSFTDLLGFGLVSLVCFLYSLYGPYFAEWHIQYPFLNFPIFVGEFLIAFCLLVVALKWSRQKPSVKRWHLVVAIYFAWVVAKALIGYCEYGALAFRNAALFYYPIFTLFGYVFFNKKMFTDETKSGMLTAIAMVIWFKYKGFYGYFWFISLLLYVPILLSIRNRIAKGVFFVVGVCLYYNIFRLFNLSRSHMLGLLMVFFILGIFFVFSKLKCSLGRKIVVICLLILTVLTVMTCCISRGVLDSVLAPGRIAMLFWEGERWVLSTKDTFLREERSPRLYNRNLSKEEQLLEEEERKMRRMARIAAAKRLEEHKVKGVNTGSIRVVEVEATGQTEKEYILVDGEYRGRAIDGPQFTLKDNRRRISYGNIVFRLFIWRDMWEEFKAAKAPFGISFGKPQRSISIEILRWSPIEWKRDGWITPHNSFFHMIYRGGIVGLMLGLFVYGSVLYLTKEFFLKNAASGVFMTAILSYWIVLSNFLVILELPYNAIPFWTLLGVAFAYNYDLQKKVKGAE